MSNQQTENPENQTAVPKKSLLPTGCLILLVAAITFCMLPILINTVTVFFNQIKWHSAQISNYRITVGIAGPGSQSQTVIVQDGKFSKSTSNFLRDRQDGIPALNLTVDDLFSHAYTCFIYQLCRVEFDEVYGYPNYVGGGFIETGGFYANSLEPIAN